MRALMTAFIDGMCFLALFLALAGLLLYTVNKLLDRYLQSMVRAVRDRQQKKVGHDD